MSFNKKQRRHVDSMKVTNGHIRDHMNHNGDLGKLEKEMNNEATNCERTVPRPPDGGWGWVIVFCSFMIHVIADGVTYTFGIFYTELVNYYGEGKGFTAWVTSIMTGVTYGIGPIASGLTNKYGCRAITIAGAILASSGLLASIFAKNVHTLFFTIGICAGAGFGLIYLPAIVSVTMYFEKRRAFATGIAVCGSGIGQAIFAPVTYWLVQTYEWQGAMALVAVLILHCCAFGGLMRPLEVEPAGFGRDDKRKLPRLQVTRDSERCPMITSAENFHKEPNGFPPLEPDSPDVPLAEGYGLTVQSTSPSRHSFSAFKLSTSYDEEPIRAKYASLELVSSPNVQRRNSKTMQDTHREPRSRKASTSSEYRSQHILGRKDIFYSRSLNNIPEYKSHPELFSASMATGLNRSDVYRTPQNSSCCPQEISEAFNEMMDFKILANPVFLLFAVSNFVTSLGYYVPFNFLEDLCRSSNLANESDASQLLAYMGIGSTVGRVVFGYISDHSFVNRLYLYNWCLTVCGFSVILCSFVTDYNQLLICTVTFGVTFGKFTAVHHLTSVILVDLLGLEKLTNAFGVLLLFQGTACLIGPPIVGWLYDLTGSYSPGFNFAGASIALSGLMLFFVPVVERRCSSHSISSIKCQTVKDTDDGDALPVKQNGAQLSRVVASDQ
ncbi:Monocarboxylate transporter 9 [Halotydeus destructor]|nr:Monocarboxylate transporter 9 [Halotydeus destructor]